MYHKIHGNLRQILRLNKGVEYRRNFTKDSLFYKVPTLLHESDSDEEK